MNWLYNLKTQRKLLILNILLAVNLAWISGAAIMRINRINALISEMYEEQLVGLSTVRHLQASLAGLDANRTSVIAAMDDEKRQRHQELFAGELKTIKGLALKGDSLWSEADAAKGAAIRAEFERVVGEISELLPLEEDLVRRAMTGDETVMADKMLLDEQSLKNSENLNALSQELEKAAAEAFATSQDYYGGTVRGQMIIIVVGIVINVLMGIFIAGLITKPLSRIAQTTDKLAQGDLTDTAAVASRDEIGLMAKSLNRAIENLRALIKQVTKTAEQVAASSEQLAASSGETGKTTTQVASTIEQLAKGTEEQASSATTADETVHQMTALLAGMSEQLAGMVRDSGRASDLANTGRESVRKAIGQMTSIRETVETSAFAVKGLGERSREIGQIVDVITGIADQTNLLALNAAIEAARAGEQGRGFAVVAEEVRKLAEQSRQAAEKISGLIREIQTETGKAVNSMEAGTREVASGTSVIDETGAAFAQIAEAVETVVHQINEVSRAAQQVVQGSEQVVQAVENIANITEEAAASAQEVSASAEEQTASVQQIASSAEALSQVAQELQHEVSKFIV